MNQLKKVAIGVDTICLASDSSGSETNAQGAVAIFASSTPSSVIVHNHVSFSVRGGYISSQDYAQGNLLAAMSGYDLRSYLARQNTKIKSAIKEQPVLAWRWRAFSFRVKAPVWENNYRQRSV